ncbi:MAG: HutD family protein [Myxococcales bacterium]|nr:HutD family protein [Myxococcales bacterium]
MPLIERIDAGAWRSAPWGAAQGTSHEIARWPAGAAAARLARVSVAEITAPGPFTRLPGYRRWLCVLDDGGGLTLTIDGRAWHGTTGAAIEFGGADDVTATITGPARVWNLIARADVTWTAARLAAVEDRALPAGVAIVYATSARVGVEVDGHGHGLPATATLIATSSQPLAVRVGAGPDSAALVVHLALAPSPQHGGAVVMTPPPEQVVTLDGAAMTTPAEFHAELARQFGFPAFYGANLDALIDCLTYLDEPDARMSAVHAPPGGIVVIALTDAAAVPAALYQGFVDALAFVNHRRRERGGRAVVALAAHR